MEKIKAWFRGHAYQWERTDYKKVCGQLSWVAIVSVIGLMATSLLLEQFGGSERDQLFAVIIWGYFLMMSLGGAYFIKWADLKLKKEETPN